MTFNGPMICWNQNVTQLKKGLVEPIRTWEKVEGQHNVLPFKQDIFVGWKHLNYPKIKVNTNCAKKGNPCLASTDFVLRDVHRKSG